MKESWKEIVLYPATIAVICTGVNLFADWRRNTVDTVWAYVIMAVIMFIVIACGKLIIKRKRG